MGGCQKLSSKQAAEAALRAYEKGLLGFQSQDRAKQGCRYMYPDGGVCSIGAVLKERGIDASPYHESLSKLLQSLKDDLGLFFDISSEEYGNLLNLQNSHDLASQSVRSGGELATIRKEHFLALARRLSA